MTIPGISVSTLGRTRVDLLGLALGRTDGVLPNSLAGLDRAIGGSISRFLRSGDFTGKAGEWALLYPARRMKRVLLVGLGPPEDMTRDAVRRAASVTARKAASLNARTVGFLVPPEFERGVPAEALGQLGVEGLAQGAWRFSDYKAAEEERPGIDSMEVVAAAGQRAGLEKGASHGRATAAGQWLARRLQAEPGNVCGPDYLADTARDLARRHGFKVTVWGRRELERAKMGGILAVSQGSAREPRLIVLEYSGKKRGAPLCLIGKGVTFDSGGISIKPAQSMEEMKYDMSGAAAVLGAFEVLGAIRPAVNTVGIIPAVENMPSGTAMRPGDIVQSHFGKTIEVVNTDAEGRLILADALSHARKFKPACVIDAATLTGAVVIGLGHHATGLMGNDDSLLEEVRAAGSRAGERCWALPLWAEYRELIKSDVADVKNSGGRSAGSITAGWFLREFVDGYSWCHLDIAGTAYTEADSAHLAKGPTGVGVRLFSEFILGRAAG